MYNPGLLFFPSGNVRSGNISVLLATKFCYYLGAFACWKRLLAYSCLPVGKDQGDSYQTGFRKISYLRFWPKFASAFWFSTKSDQITDRSYLRSASLCFFAILRLPDRVVCEICGEAEETVEHRVWSMLYVGSLDINSKSFSFIVFRQWSSV